MAAQLGFDDVAANSLDVSSDRDFIVEFAFCLALIAEHLSTWAEEWILWSTVEFGFLRLPQAFCTGSSIMPQKVNPDVLELIRGKSGTGSQDSIRALFNLSAQEQRIPDGNSGRFYWSSEAEHYHGTRRADFSDCMLLPYECLIFNPHP